MTKALSPGLLKKLRLTHLYLGVFAAPAILFFAITGAIQTFGLHEASPGSSYQPPKIVLILAQIHKKQTPILPVRKPRPPAQAAGEDHGQRHLHSDAPLSPPQPAPAARHATLPLKIFFLIVAISLIASTFSGLYMSYAYHRSKTVITTLLILGIVVPVLLAIF